MRRPIPVLLVPLAVAVVACGSGGSGDANPTGIVGATETSISPAASAAEDPLVGVWDTGPYMLDGKNWEANITFYDEGGVPFEVLTGWDPTKGPMPQDGDHGPYKLLANNRIVFISADNGEIGATYSYKLAGDKLTLTFLHNNPDGPDAGKGGPFTTLHFTRS